MTAYGLAGGRERTPLIFADFPRLARLIAFFIYATGEETFGRDLAVLAGMVADGRLKVRRDTRSWDETREGVQSLRERAVRGKLVLTVN